MTERIAVTIGDPAGVGAEIVLKALSDSAIAELASWVVVGDEAPLQSAGRVTGIDPGSLCCTYVDAGMIAPAETLALGELRSDYGLAAVEYVRRATRMCLDGDAAAMVTAPLNKEAVVLSGQPFCGHTEYIAALCQVKESRMLLASPRLSTVHVTTHVPLEQACRVDGSVLYARLSLAMRRCA